MDREFESLIVSALLHDIGKFYQRTGEKLEKEDDFWITQCCKKIRTEHGEKYAYVHAVYSGKFVRKNLREYEDVETLVMYHHLPENSPDQKRYLAKILTLSDWLSAGERRDREEDEDAGDPQRTPLISILSTISLDSRKPKIEYLPLAPLDENLDNIFPLPEQRLAISEDSSASNSYRKLWDEFVGEFDKLDKSQLLEELYYLLQKFTIFVPSSVFKDVPDVSLFHHLKSTAAIAACLYILKPSEDTVDRVFRILKNEETHERADMEEPFLLVGGDISGIQEFIYSVTTERALKGLRGRSFYLQLLSETAAKKILNAFYLPEINLIYSGGGNFYLLVPNTQTVIERINEIKSQIDDVLIRAHKGKLALNVAYEPIRWLDFTDFRRVWEDLGRKLAISKKRKFSHVFLGRNGTSFFEPYEQGGELSGCEICGEELEEGEECSFCRSFIDLSTKLIKAKCIGVKDIKPLRKQKYESWAHVLESLGFLYELSERPDRKAYLINSTSFSEKFRGYRFVARNTAREGNEILTLEKIADRAKGIKKWGILRADVDDMGKIFKDGLGERRTISRMSMLSFMISLYFSGRVETLLSKKYRDRASIIYSGGDDLLIVASWSDLPEIAMEIYEDFRKFASSNLSLSAGIYLAPSKKFPIYESAKSAGSSLEIAKDHGKNRVTLFEQPIPWEDFKRLMKIAESVRKLIEDYGQRSVPRSLISILHFGSQEKELVKERKIPLARVWRIFYAFRRLARPYKEGEPQLSGLNELLKNVVTDHEVMPYLDVVTRWADFLVRKEG